MNPMFSMKWAHAHHGIAHWSDTPQRNPYSSIVWAIALVILFGAVLVVGFFAQTLYPEVNFGTGNTINQLDSSRVAWPWVSQPY